MSKSQPTSPNEQLTLEALTAAHAQRLANTAGDSTLHRRHMEACIDRQIMVRELKLRANVARHSIISIYCTVAAVVALTSVALLASSAIHVKADVLSAFTIFAALVIATSSRTLYAVIR